MPPKPKPKPKETAEDVRKKAPEKLRLLKVNSPFFDESQIKQFPVYQLSELTIGNRLGSGGYCNVLEIKAINLSDSEKKEEKVEESMVNGKIDMNMEPEDDCIGLDPQEEADKMRHLTPFDEKKTRKFMVKHCLRDGSARYAIKKLRQDLTEYSRARGILDLAIEIEFLSALDHPNIVKIRGTAAGDKLNPENFIVMDRLYGTLEERIEVWKVEHKMNAGCMGCIGTNKDAINELTLERYIVAYDIANAMKFIHSRNLIWRDVKPDNIGFDVRGDAKLFDFGLCKELRSELRVKGDLYKLTGLTGSRLYMAPEVMLCQPYNTTADVYSYGLLLHQILTFQCPFETFDPRDLLEKVAKGGYRPSIPMSIPASNRRLIGECWSAKIVVRPDFQRIASLMRDEMNMLAVDESEVLHRTQHMMNRTEHSTHGDEDDLPSKRNPLAMSCHGEEDLDM